VTPCGGAPVMGRRHQWVHKLHHTGVVLLGMHTNEDEAVGVLSMKVVATENRAPACDGLP
jgi:putative NIF3 family GTP cyclohydrolase 1 type 2